MRIRLARWLLLLVIPASAFGAGPATDSAPASEDTQTQPADEPAASQPAGLLIEGIVTNAMGGGIHNAVVRLERADGGRELMGECKTGPAGEVSMRLGMKELTQEIHARVIIRHPSFSDFSQEVELQPGEDLPYIDATLKGAARIVGQVRRLDDNAPIAGADVSTNSGGRDITAKTDSRGRFRLDEVDHGTLTVVVRAPGWAHEYTQVKVEEDETKAFIELKPERPIDIVATLPDGKPASELNIEISVSDTHQWFQAVTDEAGKVTVHGAPATARKLDLRYNGTGYVQMSGFEKSVTLPKARSSTTKPSDFEPTLVKLEVLPAATIHGKVVNAKGEPVLGVRIIAGRESYGYMPMTWTAADGTYELGGLSVGNNVISFQNENHATHIAELRLEAGQTATLDAKLSHGAPIRARVVDDAGKPVAGAWVTAERWNGYTTLGMRTVTDKDGTFEFAHAPEGDVEISIQQVGFGSVSENFTAGKPPRDVAMKKLEENENAAAAGGGGRPAKLKVGDAVPELTLKATDGKTYKLSELKGQYVFIDCWASWCGPCMGEVPNVKALRKATKDRKDFIMIGVNLDQDRAAFDKAVEKHEMDWIHATGADSGAEKVFGTLDGFGIPYTCVIGPDGKLLAQHLRGESLPDEVGKLLPEEKK